MTLPNLFQTIDKIGKARLSNPDSNCMGFAMHVGGFVEREQFLTPKSSILVDMKKISTPLPGSLVMFQSKRTGFINHMGVVMAVDKDDVLIAHRPNAFGDNLRLEYLDSINKEYANHEVKYYTRC
jgi:hypothetical protein